MTLKFRNVAISPDRPVSEWPGEAVLTALERGSLCDWRRLARAVQQEPWGPTARRIEQALGVRRPYGIAPAMEAVLAAARQQQVERERRAVAQQVRQLIAASRLKQSEFAAGIGTSRSRLSTYATGKVVPSAAMLVRMQQFARRCRDRHADPAAAPNRETR